MGVNMNVFRVLADLSHTASKCILIWAIHRNKSAEGVSLLTQLLYVLVFCTRYLDLFWVAPSFSYWNEILKIFYIVSSAYIVWLMMRVYARTREKEYAWKLATWSLAACLLSAPLVCLIFEKWSGFTWFEVTWTFSIELESVCVLPQLLLLRQTSVPTVIDSYYLVTLGAYRFLYILNWILRVATEERASFPIRGIFGVIQTALYADFAWVYYSRQRVKLRGGAIVDGDDLSKSLFVRRIIGRGSRADRDADDDEAEAGLAGNVDGNSAGPGRSWGARGISVSADDTLHDHHGAATNGGQRGYADSAAADDARMIDPSHFEDDDDDDDANAPPSVPSGNDKSKSHQEGDEDVDESAAAWAENTGRHP